MTARPRLGRALLAVFYIAPWAWLICFGIFVSAVTIKVGHFPSYSNPDPKHVEGLGALYLLTVALLLPVLLSPILIGGYAVSLLWRGLHVELWKAAVYVLGVAFTASLLLGNAFDLGNWLFD